MAPDFLHQIIEQAYKTALESPEAAESFKREYRAKHGGHRYYAGKAASAEGAFSDPYGKNQGPPLEGASRCTLRADDHP
jgi:hypothetical protein